jgi:RNA polymerase sigma factor (TIGR02999 family)
MSNAPENEPRVGRQGKTVSATPASADLTRWLHAWRGGDQIAFAKLSDAVYQTVHDMARARLSREPSATLQATELAHEAFLRVMGADVPWTDRAHFFAVVARNMRTALIDHARARAAGKRGAGALKVTLDERLESPDSPSAQVAIELLALDQALHKLSALDARAAEVVEMSYFGGLEQQEIAEVLQLSVTTVERALRFARAWLKRECAA